MHRRLLLAPWPRTPDGDIMFMDTEHALMYAALVWDEKLQCKELYNQLQKFRADYEALKGQANVNLDHLSALAFAIQFTREAMDETYDLQVRARKFISG